MASNANGGDVGQASEVPSGEGDQRRGGEAWLQATLDSLLDPHVVLTAVRDETGHIVDFRYDDANAAAYAYFDMSRDELIGSRLLDLFPRAKDDGSMNMYIDVIETGNPMVVDDAPFENTLRGEERYYDLRGVRMNDSMVFSIRDVTERHEAAERLAAVTRRLAESEELYRLLVENAWDVIWTMELDGSISYVSPAVERVRGITPADAAVQPPEEMQPPESLARGAEYYARLFEAIANGTELPQFHGEQEYYRTDGSIMLGELDVIPQVDAEGNVVRILGVTRDISEQRRFEDELNRLAVTDPLTGVWNRRQGENLFSADLSEARRYGPALSLLMIDIDHFKAINDRFGHQAGDYVLIDMTRRISANLRSSDALARWGGEEFVVVMRHCTIADAIPLAEKIRALIADTPFVDVGTVTVSIGAAELQPDDDLSSWLHRADRAMYDAKAAGRNAVRVMPRLTD